MLSNKSYKKINIIGAGPAGICAAIMAANTLEKQNTKHKFAEPFIELFDTSDRIGKTILKTGNGRCNFSNIKILEEQGEKYNNPKFFQKVNLALYNTYQIENHNQKQNNPVLNFFENLGLLWDTKNDGMLFPKTNKASTVLDVLRYEIEDYCNKGILHLNLNSKISNFNEDEIYIVCPGALLKEEKPLLSIKVKYNPTQKILGPIKTENHEIKKLDGTRVKANIKVTNKDKTIFNQNGEVLFRKYGLSGIVIFNASRFIARNQEDAQQQKIIVDYLPDLTEEELSKCITSRFKKDNDLSNINKFRKLLAGILLPNIADVLYNRIEFKKIEISKIAHEIKNFTLQVKGIGDEKQCQVSRGGISTEEIDPHTMKILSSNNIYVAGEIIDIDGPCGGYNLHWAWMSGMLAGISAANQISSE